MSCLATRLTGGFYLWTRVRDTGVAVNSIALNIIIMNEGALRRNWIFPIYVKGVLANLNFIEDSARVPPSNIVTSCVTKGGIFAKWHVLRFIINTNRSLIIRSIVAASGEAVR